MSDSNATTISGWIVEVYPKKYLKFSSGSADLTDSIFEAKVFGRVDVAEHFASDLYIDWDDVGEDYPKFHSVKMTAEILETAEYVKFH